MQNETTLTIAEQIDRAKDGRTQRHIVGKMAELGYYISEPDFSTKKKLNAFSDEELRLISRILGKKIVKAK